LEEIKKLARRRRKLARRRRRGGTWQQPQVTAD
jgi:hypothetical protein